MNRMNPPKILPWIAKRAGISEELALKLWRRAVVEAQELCGESEGSEYWGLAVERFLSLAEDEANAVPTDGLTPAPRLSWMWRHQNRMSMLGLMAAQNTYRYWQSSWQHTWQRLCQPPKKAA